MLLLHVPTLLVPCYRTVDVFVQSFVYDDHVKASGVVTDVVQLGRHVRHMSVPFGVQTFEHGTQRDRFHTFVRTGIMFQLVTAILDYGFAASVGLGKIRSRIKHAGHPMVEFFILQIVIVRDDDDDNMYDVQSNKARFIYTISLAASKATDTASEASTVRLVNGFYFSKVTRSDEKLIYTEHDMTSILRTVLCMHVFRITPRESIQDIVYSGLVTFADDDDGGGVTPLTVYEPDLSVERIVDIVDSLLGKSFCSVVARPLANVYSEYKHEWRYYAFGRPVALPSAADFVRLYRFVNAPNYRLSAATRFVVSNGDDHKIPLQNRIKRLPL